MTERADLGSERPLTDLERALLTRLLAESFVGAEALRAQLPSCRARDWTGDAWETIDLVVDEDAPRATSPYSVPIEGTWTDRDGVPAHVLVHVRRGRLAELELYKDDGGEILAHPQVESLWLFTPCPS